MVALDLLTKSEDERIKLHAAELIGDRLLPKLRSVEHTGELDHNVTVITHRYGRVPQGKE